MLDNYRFLRCRKELPVENSLSVLNIDLKFQILTWILVQPLPLLSGWPQRHGLRNPDLHLMRRYRMGLSNTVLHSDGVVSWGCDDAQKPRLSRADVGVE